MSGKRGQVTSNQTSRVHPGLMQRSDIVYVEIPPLSGWWQKECSVTTTITRLVRWLSMCRVQRVEMDLLMGPQTHLDTLLLLLMYIP